MVDEIEMTPEEDEVILCVRYTTVTGWLCIIVLTLFGFWLCHGSYEIMLKAKYLQAVVVLNGGFLCLAFGTEVLLTKHIIFYGDRLAKVWYLFGRRTIPYSRAKLWVNPGWMLRMYGEGGKAFRVIETDAEGRPLIVQMFIGYCYLCVSRETREQVLGVTSYLVGVEDSTKLYERSRRFARTTLSKEVLCQGQ